MGVAEKDMKLLWLDLETTGLDKETEDILEVGVCVTDWSFSSQDEGMTVVVEPRWTTPWREICDPYALKMHEESGLAADLDAGGITAQDAEAAVLAYAQYHGCKPGETMMAGSGVSRYDLRFLERQMPDLARFLHYRQLDVSPIRSLLLGTGLTHLLPPEDSRAHRDNRKHRALDDVMDSIAEVRHYADVFSTSMTLTI